MWRAGQFQTRAVLRTCMDAVAEEYVTRLESAAIQDRLRFHNGPRLLRINRISHASRVDYSKGLVRLPALKRFHVMASPVNRRIFMGSSLAATLSATSQAVAGGGTLLPGLAAITDEQVQQGAATVRFLPDIEPLVRLIEETPRQRLMEEVGHRVRHGLSYQQLLAALFLAGIRNIQPRPAVGFKFHAVLVVNSAHVASLASPDHDRWLPIFWALDEFKSSQARDVNEGNWTMPAVNEAQIPSPENTVTAFRSAMEKWDEQAADTAAAGIARFFGANQMLDLFAQFSARDFRSIGHKSIYLANSWRTLQTIGWQHSEPVIRSLAYALLNHNGESNPSEADYTADRSWRHIETIVDSIRPNWMSGKTDRAAARDLLAVLRTANPDDVSQEVVRLLNMQVSPQAVWDAVHLGAAELLKRQSGIVALHASTTANALHFLFENVGDDRTRRMLLLQAAAFLPQFREAMRSRGNMGEAIIDAAPVSIEMPEDSESGLETVLSAIRRDPEAADARALAWLDAGFNPESLFDATRRLIFLKGNDAHDYKFSSAVLEDFYKISPDWRNSFLAASTRQFRGSQDKDNGLITRIRAALS